MCKIKKLIETKRILFWVMDYGASTKNIENHFIVNRWYIRMSLNVFRYAMTFQINWKGRPNT